MKIAHRLFFVFCIGVVVSVSDHYTIHFSSASDAEWFDWSKTLHIDGKEIRELRYQLDDLLGPDTRCINIDLKTVTRSIGECREVKP
jgi:hypothetical protein